MRIEKGTEYDVVKVSKVDTIFSGEGRDTSKSKLQKSWIQLHGG